MTRESAIKWAPEIKAFQEGKQIQGRKIGNTEWMDYEFPMFDEDFEYRIKPEQTKRLPTIEEVKEWFMENRVFINKEKTFNCRIQAINENTTNIHVGGRGWYDLKFFCEDFTHADGSELYITEKV